MYRQFSPEYLIETNPPGDSYPPARSQKERNNIDTGV